jgi:hypothetical protein
MVVVKEIASAIRVRNLHSARRVSRHTLLISSSIYISSISSLTHVPCRLATIYTDTNLSAQAEIFEQGLAFSITS